MSGVNKNNGMPVLDVPGLKIIDLQNKIVQIDIYGVRTNISRSYHKRVRLKKEAALTDTISVTLKILMLFKHLIAETLTSKEKAAIDKYIAPTDKFRTEAIDLKLPVEIKSLINKLVNKSNNGDVTAKADLFDLGKIISNDIVNSVIAERPDKRAIEGDETKALENQVFSLPKIPVTDEMLAIVKKYDPVVAARLKPEDSLVEATKFVAINNDGGLRWISDAEPEKIKLHVKLNNNTYQPRFSVKNAAGEYDPDATLQLAIKMMLVYEQHVNPFCSYLDKKNAQLKLASYNTDDPSITKTPNIQYDAELNSYLNKLKAEKNEELYFQISMLIMDQIVAKCKNIDSFNKVIFSPEPCKIEFTPEMKGLFGLEGGSELQDRKKKALQRKGFAAFTEQTANAISGAPAVLRHNSGKYYSAYVEIVKGETTNTPKYRLTYNQSCMVRSGDLNESKQLGIKISQLFKDLVPMYKRSADDTIARDMLAEDDPSRMNIKPNLILSEGLTKYLAQLENKYNLYINNTDLSVADNLEKEGLEAASKYFEMVKVILKKIVETVYSKSARKGDEIKLFNNLVFSPNKPIKIELGEDNTPILNPSFSTVNVPSSIPIESDNEEKEVRVPKPLIAPISASTSTRNRKPPVLFSSEVIPGSYNRTTKFEATSSSSSTTVPKKESKKRARDQEPKKFKEDDQFDLFNSSDSEVESISLSEPKTQQEQESEVEILGPIFDDYEYEKYAEYMQTIDLSQIDATSSASHAKISKKQGFGEKKYPESLESLAQQQHKPKNRRT